MASNLYTRKTADGKITTYTRKGTQGRKPIGLSKPKLYRLSESTRRELDELKIKFGYLYNENEIIRFAAEKHIHSIYTELVNT
jgi:hypothetical protein